jgi:hypothetical protein
VLALPCCGGVALLGLVVFSYRAVESRPAPVMVQPLPPAQPMPVDVPMPVEEHVPPVEQTTAGESLRPLESALPAPSESIDPAPRSP